MKKILFILFSLLFLTNCELDDFTWTRFVNTKFYARVYDKSEAMCKIYHNNEVEHTFVLNEANDYTTVKRLILDEEYTVVTTINDEIQTRTFKANCDNASIIINIIIDPSVEEVEDEVIFEN